MKALIKAVLAVMDEVKGIDKSLTVGSGYNSYKGVSDKDVKLAIGTAMQKNELICIPTAIEPITRVDRWEQDGRQKQSVFTEVKCTYQLIHSSGEQLEIVGYGHGVDTQDKSAGKATTYALKNALLYSFLVPTGHIDDTDKIHSESAPIPPKESLTPSHAKWAAAQNAIKEGKTTIQAIKKSYNITAEDAKKLQSK